MMNRPRIAVLGLFAGLVAVTSLSTRSFADGPSTSHVGVVNLRLVYTTIQETVDSQHQLQGMQDELDVLQKAHQRDLKDMTDAMNNNTKPGTDARAAKMEEFDTKGLQFQQEEQAKKVKMVRTQAKQLVAAYKEIQAAVADQAKKKGLDLVLVSSGNDLPDNAQDIANPETLGNLIFQRNILFAADKVDITADVTAALNAAYKAGPAPAK